MEDKTGVKKRDKEQTKRKICEKAKEAFCTQNYDAVSTKKIAESAGVNSALIFNYFGNKEGLFNYVFNEILTNGDLSLPAFEYKDTVEEEIQCFTATYVKSIMERRGLLRNILFMNNDKTDFQLSAMYKERMQPVVSRIEHFQKLGQISQSIDAEVFADSFLHMIDGMVITYTVYSNETTEYILGKIKPLLAVYTAGLSCTSH